jgi:hypothetical protein
VEIAGESVPVPIPLCKEVCLRTEDICQNEFSLARQYNLYTYLLPDCAGVRGFDPLTTDISTSIEVPPTDFYGPEGYMGAEIYPGGSELVNYRFGPGDSDEVPVACSSGNQTELVIVLPVSDCPFYMMLNPNQATKEALRTEGLDTEDCSARWETIACIPKCAGNKIYTADEVHLAWLVYAIPAVMGFVSSLTILICWIIGRKKSHKDIPTQILLIAGFGLVYATIDTFPVMLLYTDLPCKDETGLNRGDTVACQFNELSTHILQVQYYLVGSLLSKAYIQTVGQASVRTSRKVGKASMVASIALPLITAFATIMLPIPNCYASNYQINQERMHFRCQPFMAEMWQEWLTVHLHFTVGGAIIFGFISSILKYALELSSKSATDNLKSSNGNRYLSYFLRALFANIFNSQFTKLFMLGSACLVLLFLNLYVNLATIGQLENWLEVDETFETCVLTAVSSFEAAAQREACLDFMPTGGG